MRYDFLPSRTLRDGIGKKVTDAPTRQQAASHQRDERSYLLPKIQQTKTANHLLLF